MSLKVIGASVSPFVRKVRAFLAVKGVEYEQDPVNPFAAPEGFREVSPLGRIPALQDGDRTLADSSIICAYLERRHPEPALYPKDDYDYARALWIEEYMDGGAGPVAGPGVFAPLVLQPLLTGTEPDEEGPKKVVAEDLPKFWDYLESQIEGKEFFVGGSLSIADLAVASPMVNLRLAGVFPDAGRWPSLHGFIERMHEGPIFQPLIEEDRAIFGKRWV